ncbi:hypothetical protein Tsubulata_044867 [Turnera subulata]|uniref:Uncharacterized protein n=1 Tax=Turnera subulata TaxID=218843 RepID=A0A9Q0J2D7_9ROSI|nr:hypothetical protein Tsubulata_044867 [Turnera subulata]
MFSAQRKSLTPEIKINLSRFTATATATTSPPLCLLHNFLIVVSSSSLHERRHRGRFQFQSSVDAEAGFSSNQV